MWGHAGTSLTVVNPFKWLLNVLCVSFMCIFSFLSQTMVLFVVLFIGFGTTVSLYVDGEHNIVYGTECFLCRQPMCVCVCLCEQDMVKTTIKTSQSQQTVQFRLFSVTHSWISSITAQALQCRGLSVKISVICNDIIFPVKAPGKQRQVLEPLRLSLTSAVLLQCSSPQY